MREQLYAELLVQIDQANNLKRRQKRRLKRKLERSDVFREYVLDSLTVQVIGQGVVDMSGPQAAIDWQNIDWAALLAFIVQIVALFGGGS